MKTNYHIAKLDCVHNKKVYRHISFILAIIIAIIIIFDISEKIDEMVEKEAPLKEIVF
jgi:predicted membrane protein